MASNLINYTLKEVEEGFVARCSTNPKVTAFGNTKIEVENNLKKSILEYLKIYPDKRDEIFNSTTTKVDLR